MLVIADETADATVVAADLLAQAEHDPSASSYLITTSAALQDQVEAELKVQLPKLGTREIASASLKNGYSVLVGSIDEACAISDRNAPEHLEIHVADAMNVKRKLQHYGGLFVGTGAAEVLGDYGAGPNHTLPTGGTARSTGGLCVLTFMRVRTWMRVDDKVAAQRMTQDAVMLGELEGLVGHAAAAAIRLPGAAAAAGEVEPLGSPRSKGISTKGRSPADAGRLTFAVPKKGRFSEKCLKFLEAAGLEYTRPDRVDVAVVDNMPITLVFLPAKDIAQYVGEGNVDIGMTGEDMVAEAQVSVHVALKLGFGKCRLALQVPNEHATTKRAGDYQGARIVTSFPNVAKKFFAPLDAAAAAANPAAKPTEIRYLSGSVEAACGLGLADAVVDLVETGTTMRAAGLEVLASIMDTQAILITNPQSQHPELTAKICARIQGYMDSTKYQLMQYNVPRSKLPEAVKITPGKKSPSILPLEKEDWVAVSVMVSKKEVANIIDQLDAVGATDILVFSLTNCRV